jgi:hypothetical protein
MKNVEHPWVSMDIYLVEFTGKFYSGIRFNINRYGFIAILKYGIIC